MKDLYKFELSVLIEKNRYNNEKKLNTEIEKMFAKNHHLKEIKLVQFKKSKQNPTKISTAPEVSFSKTLLFPILLTFYANYPAISCYFAHIIVSLP